MSIVVKSFKGSSLQPNVLLTRKTFWNILVSEYTSTDKNDAIELKNRKWMTQDENITKNMIACYMNAWKIIANVINKK